MEELDITVRHMRTAFDFDELEDALILQGRPEESYFIIAASLILPGLEPYLIRSMKSALKQIRSESLRKEIQLFNGQEGQHYRQHQRFNDVIKQRGFPGLAEWEQRIQSEFQRLTKTKSLRFNIAYTASFEIVTTVQASLTFDLDSTADFESSARQLFEWHMMEEIEHRFVGWDVYHHLFGDIAGKLYLRGMLVYQMWHVYTWANAIAAWMRKTDPAYPQGYGGKSAIKGRRENDCVRELERAAIPRTLRFFLPGFTPHNFELKSFDQVAAVSRRYTELAAAQQS